MENERYSLEKAQEEAAELQKEVESGEALTYSEAESQLEQNNSDRVEDKNESVALGKVIEFDSKENSNIVFHNPGFKFEGLGGVLSLEQILEQGILSKKIADKAKIQRSGSGYSPAAAYDSGTKGVATLTMDAFVQGYDNANLDDEVGGLGRDRLRKGITLMIKASEKDLATHDETLYYALEKAKREGREIDQETGNKLKYNPEGMNDVFLHRGEVILKSRVKPTDIIGLDVQKGIMELTVKEVMEKLTDDIEGGLLIEELSRIAMQLGIDVTVPNDLNKPVKNELKSELVTEIFDADSDELKTYLAILQTLGQTIPEDVTRQIDKGENQIKVVFENKPKEYEIKKHSGEYAAKYKEYVKQVNTLLLTKIFGHERFKGINTLGDYILQLAKKHQIPVYVEEELIWPKSGK